MDDDARKKWVTKALEKGMNNTATKTITKIAAVYETVRFWLATVPIYAVARPALTFFKSVSQFDNVLIVSF